MLQTAIAARGRLIDLQYPNKRLGKPIEIAELVLWLLCDSSKFITATVQSIDGGWAS